MSLVFLGFVLHDIFMNLNLLNCLPQPVAFLAFTLPVLSATLLQGQRASAGVVLSRLPALIHSNGLEASFGIMCVVLGAHVPEGCT